MTDSADPELVTKVTFDMNDGEMVQIVEVAAGALSGGWGINHIEIKSSHPVRPEHFADYLHAVANMVLSGGVTNLIAAHEAQDARRAQQPGA